jgi:hypothetical protein
VQSYLFIFLTQHAYKIIKITCVLNYMKCFFEPGTFDVLATVILAQYANFYFVCHNVTIDHGSYLLKDVKSNLNLQMLLDLYSLGHGYGKKPVEEAKGKGGGVKSALRSAIDPGSSKQEKKTIDIPVCYDIKIDTATAAQVRASKFKSHQVCD